MKEIVITANDSGQRIDRFLKKYLANAPLSAIYKIIRKDIKLNGKRPKENDFVNEGDVLALYIPDFELDSYIKKPKAYSAKRQFTIAYEDDNVLVAVKPFGLLVHGDAVEKKNTLTNQVIDYLIAEGKYNPRTEKSFTPAPAHRLDRNTTGLVVFGKNAESLRALTYLMADKENGALKKFYYAVCDGVIKEEKTLTGYLVKDERTNKVRVSKSEINGSRFIKTIVRPLASNARNSLVEIELVTGRPHQIRAHLASIGCPVTGDPKYGHGSAQLLHAARLEFVNPPGILSNLKGLKISAAIPAKFAESAEAMFGINTEDLK